jgi:hypothetical protein
MQLHKKATRKVNTYVRETKRQINTVSVASPTKIDVQGIRTDVARLSASPDRSELAKKQRTAHKLDNIALSSPLLQPALLQISTFHTTSQHSSRFNVQFCSFTSIQLFTDSVSHSVCTFASSGRGRSSRNWHNIVNTLSASCGCQT